MITYLLNATLVIQSYYRDRNSFYQPKPLIANTYADMPLSEFRAIRVSLFLKKFQRQNEDFKLAKPSKLTKVSAFSRSMR